MKRRTTTGVADRYRCGNLEKFARERANKNPAGRTGGVLKRSLKPRLRSGFFRSLFSGGGVGGFGCSSLVGGLLGGGVFLGLLLGGDALLGLLAGLGLLRVGWAPWSSQCWMRSLLSFTRSPSLGSVGFHEPTCSMKRPSRGERTSAMTTW
jgi:hypothetical protein